MSNEWFIIANRFSNSGKAKGLIDNAVKKLKEEKIKYSLNLTINSGDEIDLVKSATVFNFIIIKNYILASIEIVTSKIFALL